MRFGRVGIELPDESIVDTLRAQVAYMLVNAKGPVLEAGPRNYNRSFIRDGSATAAVLLRMGIPVQRVSICAGTRIMACATAA